MICDSHMHLGQYYDLYTTPKELDAFLEKVGIDAIAVSSTTTCEENFEKVLNEFDALLKISKKIIVPILWVTPSLLSDRKVLDHMVTHINWKCVKVHPQLCPSQWDACGRNFQKAVEVAKRLNVPMLIHTGVVQNCHPLQLRPLFERYSDQTFIMAHGRPIDETELVLKEVDNTLVDTAFMPTEYIVRLIKDGYEDRILWGSDYPIIRFLERNIDAVSYYENLIKELRANLNDSEFFKITEGNFIQLYNI